MFIHEKFSKVALSNPEKVALEFNSSSLTYSELEILSDKFAASLLSIGVRPGEVVGICMDRSFDQIAALLGILKAGAAYLPLDPVYPVERLNFMVSHSRVKNILTDEAHKNTIETDCNKILVTDLLKGPTSTELPPLDRSQINLVYVIYTSGSTGKPKGVSLGHKALSNLIDWQNDQTINKDTVTLQFTPVSFDVHFQEIFSTLTMGGKLVLINDNDRLDTSRFIDIMMEKNVNRLFLPFVALNHLAESSVGLNKFPDSLKEIITAGEQLKITSAIQDFFKKLGQATLYNHYGPSETHVVTSHTLSGDPSLWPSLPPIGKPISHSQILLLDSNLSPVKEYEEGEIYLSGLCLADGYYLSPELTHERFLHHPVYGRIYKTGDSGRLDHDKNLHFLGRNDGQVKIRGYRIETAEIEIKMMGHELIEQAVVVARDEEQGKVLCGYFRGKAEVRVIREYLKNHLPEYMIPSFIIKLENIPLTPSGKVDYKNLPAPSRQRPDLNQPFSPAKTELEKDICRLWMKYLNLSSVGIDDSFFDLGGNSLLALKFMVEFNQTHEKKLTVVDLFNYVSIRKLAASLGNHEIKARREHRKNISSENRDIAVVGMTGRFPGADSIEEFWKNLTSGVDSLEKFSTSETHPSVSSEIKNDVSFVPVSGEIRGQKFFDHKYFGITPREAELMDPQQRKFLELSVEALELAGYYSPQYDGSIGVFAGMGNSLYGQLVANHPEKVMQMGDFNVMLGLEKDYIATRTAFKLDLRGPALSIHTGCSTSLIAIIEAVKSLRSHDCDMALAGGISISGAPKRGHLFQEGGILTKDGHCRPFDENATGTVFSDGAGVVVLKRLSDAEADGDTILAVIKGVGINNDGSNKMSFTAPSIEGQIDVITRAHSDGDIDPRTIGYIEAHGTATPVGDPIEVEALSKAFRESTGENNFCYLGSVKSNIGHLTAAAGVAGFIKSVLTVKHGVVPGTVHFNQPNKLLNLSRTPFMITNEMKPFPDSKLPRRAAVSSFGVGGTNGHLILEEYPEQKVKLENSVPRHHLFKVSAKSQEQLEKMEKRLQEDLKKTELNQWPRISFTLEAGRKEHEFRSYFLARDLYDLGSSHISNFGKGNFSGKRDLYFMFPGQGSHYAEMGKSLYESFPIFAAHFDSCSEILKRYVPYDLKEVLFNPGSSLILDNTYYTQPAIFSIEYCLASMLIELGATPKGLLGHSIGEYVAATISGIFSLEDGLKIIAKRAQLVNDLPRGVMLSIGLNQHKVRTLIGDEAIDIAAINGAESCVVSGEELTIKKFSTQLTESGIPTLILKTSHAFHSYMMKPAVKEFYEFLETITKNQPQIPICSSVTENWESETLQTSSYWSDHIVNTVSFFEAAKRFTSEANGFFLEVGPKNTLTNILRKAWAVEKKKDQKVSQLLGDHPDIESKSFLKALGEMWLSGIKIHPDALFYPHERRRVPTITYPFEEKLVWLEHKTNDETQLKSTMNEVSIMKNTKKDKLIEKLSELFEASSGIDVGSFGPDISFIEMGMDSLFLTQIALQLKKEFKVQINFRQLLEEYCNLSLLADSLLNHWHFEEPKSFEPILERNETLSVVPEQSLVTASRGSLEELFHRQLDLMNQQMNLLKQGNLPEISKAPVIQKSRGHDIKKSKEAFGAAARIIVEKTTQMTPEQQEKLQSFFRTYIEKTKTSKEFTQDHRKHHADPRVVTGFKPESKEIIYPIVVNKSAGQKLWDLDGNEYIDMLCGFGSNFFGNGNERIKAAVIDQINKGIEVGPQHPLVGEVSKLISELTGNDRSAFCNTGSEAVLGAMRLARTVTGRDKIIVFSGSYHGINDEVIIRGARNKSLPAAPGINDSAVSNMIVLDYGTEESLQIIKDMAHEVAAVLVEPVQSRRCNFHPVEFLKEVRKITLEAQTCLIFDEVITGFRIHPGGAQAYFGIRADLCTYGKIVGGGMPIGVISGKSEYMDALDGGHWKYGDDSTPTVGVTYFAGTFVRHPLALAAAKEALLILKEGGEKLLRSLNEKADNFTKELNQFLNQHEIPLEMNNFGSLMKPKWKNETLGGEYLFALLRKNGVHTYDGFPWFINLAHTDSELKKVMQTFKKSVAELQGLGFLNTCKPVTIGDAFDPSQAPVDGARLGRDEKGNPAWFIERAGEYFMVEG